MQRVSQEVIANPPPPPTNTGFWGPQVSKVTPLGRIPGQAVR